MTTADDVDDDWTEAQDKTWCAEQRACVLSYLETEGVVHGGVAQEPVWHVGPIVAIWAIGSLRAPTRTGWWAISGDLPCDYCSSDGCPDARSAMKTIAEDWRSKVELTKPDDETIHGFVGMPAEFAPLLASRAGTLLGWAEDDSIWATQH